MDLREVGLEGVDWIHLTHDRTRWQWLVNNVMNLLVQQKAENLSTSRVYYYSSF
jgi:hypothetical protein